MQWTPSRSWRSRRRSACIDRARAEERRFESGVTSCRMVVSKLLVAAGAAAYWSADGWPTLGTDILSFLFHWVLLPHAAVYTILWILYPTVWYTKKPSHYTVAVDASAASTSAATNGKREEEEVTPADAANAAETSEATAEEDREPSTDGDGGSESAGVKTHQPESAASTPSTMSGSGATITPSPDTTPPRSAKAGSSAAAAAASPAASPLHVNASSEPSREKEMHNSTTAAAGRHYSEDQKRKEGALSVSRRSFSSTSAGAVAPAAPRHLPLKTRILSFIITRIFCLLLLTCLYINLFCLRHLHKVCYWYLPYACWCLFFAEKYGRPTGFSFRRVRKSVWWKYLGEYFPLVLLKADAKSYFPPDRNYLFGFHPHGIFSLSYTGQFGGDSGRPENDVSRLLPGITFRLTTLELNMRLPFLRHVMQTLGFVACSKENLLSILRSEERGKAVALVVGGAREALCTRAGGNDLVLNRRRGFLELALRTGASLVPVYSLGENDVYNVIDPASPYPRALSEATMKIFGFAVPIFFGRGVLQLFMPLRVPVYTMIGEPIHCPQIDNPSEKDIDTLRQRYAEELQKLYNKLKEVYRPKRDFEDIRFVE